MALPSLVKGVISFLGHVGSYRQFIIDFSKIVRPLYKLLEKEAEFNFDEEFRCAFHLIKARLIEAPIISTLDWTKPFKIMRDSSDYPMGAILGQKDDKIFRAIYYASKTSNDA